MKITDTDIHPYQLAFLKGLGMTETHFSHKEAYSEQYNKASNNANVRKYGQDGADYGYYQTNGLDVKDAIRRGIDKEIAIHLNGGGKGGKSNIEQQTIALHEYVKRKYKDVYEDLKEGTREAFDAAIIKMRRQWFGLKDRPQDALKEYKKGYLNDFSAIFPEMYK